jgi:hypothetical protein
MSSKYRQIFIPERSKNFPTKYTNYTKKSKKFEVKRFFRVFGVFCGKIFLKSVRNFQVINSYTT